MARLPIPGSDDGHWGDILNDFLSQVHNADGTLKDQVVTTPKLADSAVTSVKIAGGAATNGQVLTYDAAAPGGLSWQAVSGSAATNVTMGGDLSGPSDNAQIVPSAVGTAELATGAVTTQKVADGAITAPKLSAAGASNGQVLTFTGGVLSWQTPATASIADGSVTAPKLNTAGGTNGQVLVFDSSAPGGFSWQTMTTGSATPSGPAGGDLTGTYPSPSLASNAVVTASIADANVTSVKLADGAVTTAKLADGSVTSAKIVDGTVQEIDLAPSVIAKLNNTGSIADGSLAPTKLDTSGDTPANGEILSYNSTTQKFEWVAPASYSQVNTDWNATSGAAQLLNKPTLSSVATSGAYADLTGKPVIPTTLNTLTDVNTAGATNGSVIKYDGTNWVVGTDSSGAAGTDLSSTATVSNVTITSSTGNEAVIVNASQTLAGVMTSADKVKLDSVEQGATANQSDAFLLDRANQTGTQPITTVSGLQPALDSKLDDSQVGQPNGVAGLDASGKVPSSQLPTAVAQVNSDWGATSGVAQILNKPVIPTTLDDLSDVSASGPANGQVLAYDTASSRWVANTVTSTTVSDATPTAKGIVQLAGDLSGTASAPTVAKIGGVSLPGAAPTAGQVLTATSGSALSWTTPASAPVTSVAGKIGAVTLAATDLTDLAITSPTNGQILSYDSTLSKWKNIAAPSFTQQQTDWNATSGVSQILNKPTLAIVATTGSYTDLANQPTIPTVVDATTSAKGIVQLSGDLAGTAATPTVPGLATKEPLVTAGTTTQYYRGDKTWATLDKASVGLGNVDNTSDLNKPISTATQTALAGKANASHTHAIADTTGLQVALDAKLDDSQLGAVNGVASLDGTGKVPATQLPSYVDDVLEFASLAALPASGETGKIYVALDSNKIYRWSGATYIEVSPTTAGDPALGGDLSGTASNAQIAPNAVGTAEIADASVTSAKIADGTIAAGDLNPAVSALLTNDIRNQTTAAQTASYWINGTGRADTSVLTPAVDTATAVALTLGATAASSVDVGRQNVALNVMGSGFFNRGVTLQGMYTTANNNRMLLTGTLNSSSTSNNYGIQQALSFVPSGGSISDIMGISSEPLVGGTIPVASVSAYRGSVSTSAGSGQITRAAAFNATDVSLGAAPITNYSGYLMEGISANGGNTSGTVTNRGFNASTISAGAGSGGTVINDGVAIYQPNGSGGTTNNYGLHILGNGNGTSGDNYSIYDDSTAPVYIKANTTIGTTANPNNYALNVLGTTAVSASVITPWVVTSAVDAPVSGTLALGNINANTTAVIVGNSASSSIFNGTLSTFNSPVLLPGYTGSTSYRLRLSSTMSSSVTTFQYGIDNSLNFSPSGASLNTIYGIVSAPTLTGGSSSIGNFVGLLARVSTGAGYSGTIANAGAINVGAPTLAATNKISAYSGISIAPVIDNGGNTSGTLTNNQLYIGANTAAAATGGTVENTGISLNLSTASGAGTTRNYGLRIFGDGGTGGTGITSNWAIYNSSAAPNYIQGTVSIADNVNPNGYTLNVNGTIGSTGTITSNGVNLGWVAAPATATSTGVAGQKAYDANYLYVCVATNTWKRTALSTW